MKDRFGRTIDYMRISITDRCNLRCKYCMPYGISLASMDEILTFEEYAETAKTAVELGIRRFKITGGEPLARKGCCRLISMIKEIPGVEQVTITTNGVLLPEHLDELLEAGIDGINISLDTLDPALYSALTGGDIRPVLDSLKLLAEPHRRINNAGAEVPVKINAVSLDLAALSEKLGCDYKGSGWTELLVLAKDYPFDLRFIEMMPVGYGKQYVSVDHRKLLERLRSDYPDLEQDQRVHGNGPAVYYRIPGFQGSVGLISAMHGKFCDHCNRVRLTSKGYLKTCLSYEDGIDLRGILRGNGSGQEKRERLKTAMAEAILQKPMAHCFERPELMTERHDMVEIGG